MAKKKKRRREMREIPLDKIKPGPLRHKKGHSPLLEQIARTIYSKIGHFVYPTFEQWELGFMRDMQPWWEILIWETIARDQRPLSGQISRCKRRSGSQHHCCYFDGEGIRGRVGDRKGASGDVTTTPARSSGMLHQGNRLSFRRTKQSCYSTKRSDETHPNREDQRRIMAGPIKNGACSGHDAPVDGTKL